MSDSMPTIRDFIADCETLLSRHGKEGREFIGGRPQTARIYDTPGLTVKGGSEGELEIVIHYFYRGQDRTEDSRMDNPVICRNKAGELYRTHGEWHYARRRVQRLLAGEQAAEPIRLGAGERGWTVGID